MTEVASAIFPYSAYDQETVRFSVFGDGRNNPLKAKHSLTMRLANCPIYRYYTDSLAHHGERLTTSAMLSPPLLDPAHLVAARAASWRDAAGTGKQGEGGVARRLLNSRSQCLS